MDLSQWFLTIRFRLSIFGRSTPLPAPSLSLSLWIFPPTLLPQALPLTSPNLASASPPMPSPIPSPSCRVSEKTRHPGTGVGGAEKPPYPAHSEDMRESGTLPLERLRRSGFAPEMVSSSPVFCSDPLYTRTREAMETGPASIGGGVCRCVCVYICVCISVCTHNCVLGLGF